MKIKVIAVLLLSSALVFCSFGCNQGKSDAGLSTNEAQNKKSYTRYEDIKFEDLIEPKIYNQGEHYIVYEALSEKSDNFCYWYKIFEDNKNTVFEGGTDFQIPDIKEENGIVTLHLNCGTLAGYYRYYDSADNVFSEEYFNVFAMHNKKICYFDRDNKKLLIENPFDKTVVGEISADFSSRVLPVYEAEFLSDSEIKFSYYNINEEEASTAVYF